VKRFGGIQNWRPEKLYGNFASCQLHNLQKELFILTKKHLSKNDLISLISEEKTKRAAKNQKWHFLRLSAFHLCELSGSSFLN